VIYDAVIASQVCKHPHTGTPLVYIFDIL